MKRFFFLPTISTYTLIAAIFISYYYLNALPWAFFSFVCLGVLSFFRRSFIPYRDTLKNEGEIFLSPVHGVIKSIRMSVPTLNETHPHHEVRISISSFVEKGLYMPTSGEVSYLRANKGIKIPRDAEGKEFYRPIDEISHTDLTLTSKNQVKTLLRFIDCKYGKRPSIWLKSGDRGRGAACFGYYPFGGTLITYLPHTSDILVFEGESVVPGQTVIAAVKEVK